MEVRLLHCKNAHAPIVLTELPKLISFRLVHRPNAKASIVETELPIVTDSIPMHD